MILYLALLHLLVAVRALVPQLAVAAAVLVAVALILETNREAPEIRLQ